MSGAGSDLYNRRPVERKEGNETDRRTENFLLAEQADFELIR